MEGIGLGLIVVVGLVVIAFALSRQRKRAKEMDVGDTSWLKQEVEEPEAVVRHAPVNEFHVHSNEAMVTFDVPLSEKDDPVLNDILVDEAIEVVREKRKTLPIDDVTVIVVLAGRDQVREVGRTELPSPGELPPPMVTEMLNLTHVAKDPFAHQFESDHSVRYDTTVQVPGDELGPWRDELKVPEGLIRGLRARGIDPAAIDGPTFILALLEMFDYRVKALDEPGTHLAVKAGAQIFIRTESHGDGQHPEIDEGVIKKFVVEFGASGAQYGMLISDKYAPFLIHDVETRQPRIRFVTRERGQDFIDSMSMG
ncbi:MAG: hypothetical protein ACR2NL_10115 [Acidimicrobiia bacterium]